MHEAGANLHGPGAAPESHTVAPRAWAMVSLRIMLMQRELHVGPGDLVSDLGLARLPPSGKGAHRIVNS